MSNVCLNVLLKLTTGIPTAVFNGNDIFNNCRKDLVTFENIVPKTDSKGLLFVPKTDSKGLLFVLKTDSKGLLFVLKTHHLSSWTYNGPTFVTQPLP